LSYVPYYQDDRIIPTAFPQHRELISPNKSDITPPPGFPTIAALPFEPEPLF
jgi:hypothetical protein